MNPYHNNLDSDANQRFQEFQAHHKFLSEIDNLSINFDAVQSPEDHPLEQVFYSKLFKILSQWEKFKEYEFFIIGVNQPYHYEFDSKSIVFCLSNESHEIPQDMQKARAVFSPYSPLSNEIPNCFPIPLGYNG